MGERRPKHVVHARTPPSFTLLTGFSGVVDRACWNERKWRGSTAESLSRSWYSLVMRRPQLAPSSNDDDTESSSELPAEKCRRSRKDTDRLQGAEQSSPL